MADDDDSSIWDSVTGTLEGAANAVENTASNAYSAASDAASSAYDTASSAASTAYNVAAQTASDAYDSTTQIVSDARDYVNTGIDTAAEGARDYVNHAIDSAADTAKEIVNKGVDEFEKDPAAFVQHAMGVPTIDVDTSHGLSVKIDTGLTSASGAYDTDTGAVNVAAHGGVDLGPLPYLDMKGSVDADGNVDYSDQLKVTIPVEGALVSAEEKTEYHSHGDNVSMSHSAAVGVDDVKVGAHGAYESDEHGYKISGGPDVSYSKGEGEVIPGLDAASFEAKGSTDFSFGEHDGQTTVGFENTGSLSGKVMDQDVANVTIHEGVQYTTGPNGEQVIAHAGVSGGIGNDKLLGAEAKGGGDVSWAVGHDGQGNDVDRVTFSAQGDAKAAGVGETHGTATHVVDDATGIHEAYDRLTAPDAPQPTISGDNDNPLLNMISPDYRPEVVVPTMPGDGSSSDDGSGRDIDLTHPPQFEPEVHTPTFPGQGSGDDIPLIGINPDLQHESTHSPDRGPGVLVHEATHPADERLSNDTPLIGIDPDLRSQDDLPFGARDAEYMNPQPSDLEPSTVRFPGDDGDGSSGRDVFTMPKPTSDDASDTNLQIPDDATVQQAADAIEAQFPHLQPDSDADLPIGARDAEYMDPSRWANAGDDLSSGGSSDVVTMPNPMTDQPDDSSGGGFGAGDLAPVDAQTEVTGYDTPAGTTSDEGMPKFLTDEAQATINDVLADTGTADTAPAAAEDPDWGSGTDTAPADTAPADVDWGSGGDPAAADASDTAPADVDWGSAGDPTADTAPADTASADIDWGSGTDTAPADTAPADPDWGSGADTAPADTAPADVDWGSGGDPAAADAPDTAPDVDWGSAMDTAATDTAPADTGSDWGSSDTSSYDSSASDSGGGADYSADESFSG